MTIPVISTAFVLLVVGVVACSVTGWRSVRAMRRERRAGAVRDVVAAPAQSPAGRAGDAATGRRIIAVIGVDRYAHWPRLHNAVGDARGALQLFERRGFALATRRDGSVVAPLLDDAATSDAIQQLVTADLGKLDGADSLIVFFAGHGHTVVHEFPDGCTVTTGYVIPADGGPQADGARRWLRLDALLSDVARLPPRHILVILDACSSGVALQSLSALVQLRNGPARAQRDRRSRRIITSAHHDQSAQDNGPVPGHSVFTGCLIAGFATGEIASGASEVTGTEMGLYLQKRVGAHTGDAQTPDFGAFELDGRGDLVVDVVPRPAARSESAVAPAAQRAATVRRSEALTGLAGLATLLAGMSLLPRGDAQEIGPVAATASARAVEPPAATAPPIPRDPPAVAAAPFVEVRGADPRVSDPPPAAGAPGLSHAAVAAPPIPPHAAVATPPARAASQTTPPSGIAAAACRVAHDSILQSNPFVEIGDGYAMQAHEISEQEWYARDACRLVNAGPRIAKAHITQAQAQEFCRALGGELPSPERWQAAYRCAGARDAGRCAIENLADGVEEMTSGTDNAVPDNPLIYVIGGSSVLERAPTRLRRIPADHRGPVTGARCMRSP